MGGLPWPPKLCASTCAHRGRPGKNVDYLSGPEKLALARRLHRRQEGGGGFASFEWRIDSSSSRQAMFQCNRKVSKGIWKSIIFPRLGGGLRFQRCRAVGGLCQRGFGVRPCTQDQRRAHVHTATLPGLQRPPSPHVARQRRPRMGGGGPARSGAPLPLFPRLTIPSRRLRRLPPQRGGSLKTIQRFLSGVRHRGGGEQFLVAILFSIN